MNLTHRSYYTKKNKHISNSKVSDFLKSKEYYKAKHIKHTVEFNVTPSMKIGSMVDLALTKGTISAIKRKYSVKCLKRDNPSLYEKQKTMSDDYLVSETEFNKAKALSKKVLQSPLYEWYLENAAMFQVILTDNYEGVDVCGVADAITVTDSTVYLDDWKTSTPGAMRSPKHWLWHCEDLGYLRQLAHYRNMLSKTWGDKEIVCRHIVISNDSMFPQVKIYEFLHQQLDNPLREMLDTVRDIAAETQWKDDFPDHTKPELINMYD